MPKIEQILDECVERLRRGESIEQCLASYPQQAGELEPLLKTVATLREAEAQPSAEFRARVKAQALSALRTRCQREQRRAPSWPLWSRMLAPVAGVLVLMAVAGGGTIATSNGSLPGEKLYGVKLGVERVRVTLARSDLSKAKLLVSFADRRVGEITSLVEQGKGPDVNNRVDSASVALHEDLQLIGQTVGIQQAFGAGGMAATDSLSRSADPAPAASEGAAKMMAPTSALDATTTTTATATPVPAPAIKSVPGPTPTPSLPARMEIEATGIRDVMAAKTTDELQQALRMEVLRQQLRLESLAGNAQTAEQKAAVNRALQRLIAGYEAATGEAYPWTVPYSS